jgi:hypothetical protein
MHLNLYFMKSIATAIFILFISLSLYSQVTCYEYEYFGGEGKTTRAGIAWNMDTVFNKKISSLKVTEGTHLIAYNKVVDGHPAGNAKIFLKAAKNLIVDGCSDDLACLLVLNNPDNKVIFFKDRYLQGAQIAKAEGSYICDEALKSTSSIYIPGNVPYKVTLYERNPRSGSGKKKVFYPGICEYVGEDFNDKATFIKIERYRDESPEVLFKQLLQFDYFDWKAGRLSPDEHTMTERSTIALGDEFSENLGKVSYMSGPISMENEPLPSAGRTRNVLVMRPRNISRAAIMGRSNWFIPPAGCKFKAAAGFLYTIPVITPPHATGVVTARDGVTFQVWVNTKNTQGQVTSARPYKKIKTYDGTIADISIDLSQYGESAAEIQIEMIVDAGSNADGDVVGWINPRVEYTPQDSVGLLIIGPKHFKPALESYKRFRDEYLSAPSAIYYVEDLHNNITGTSDAERLKKIIYQYRAYHGTKYFVLVGKSDVIPTCFQYNQAQDNSCGDTCFSDAKYVPADLYYMNLFHHPSRLIPLLPEAQMDLPSISPVSFNNWNYRQDNKVCYTPSKNKLTDNPDWVDGYPDVLVARIPAHNQAEILIYQNKARAKEEFRRRTLAEPSPKDFSFSSDLTIFNQRRWDSTASGIERLLERERLKNLEDSRKFLKFGVGYSSATELPTGYKWATCDTVNLYLNKSRAVSYFGHANIQLWERCGPYDPYDANRVGNCVNSHFPMMLTFGCQIGQQTSATAPYGRYVDINGKIHNYDYAPHHRTPAHALNDPNVYDFENSEVHRHDSAFIIPIPREYELTRSDRTFYEAALFNPSGGIVNGTGDNQEQTNPARYVELIYEKFTEDRTYHPGEKCLLAYREFWDYMVYDCRSEDGNVPREFLSTLVFYGDPTLRYR